MSAAVVAVVVVVVVVASMFQASVGFGANVIAQPIVFQLEPSLVPGPVLLATAFLSCLVLIRDHQAVELRPMSAAVVGAVGGVGVGVFVLGLVSERSLALLVAGCVLTMVGVLALRSGPGRTNRNLVGAGMLGGFGSVTAGIGGPPVALLFADADGPRVRSSLAGYFLLASSLTFAGLVLADRFGLDELRWGVALFPGALVGFLLSGPLLPIVDRGATRPAILTVSALAAVVLIVRTLAG